MYTVYGVIAKLPWGYRVTGMMLYDYVLWQSMKVLMKAKHQVHQQGAPES